MARKRQTEVDRTYERIDGKLREIIHVEGERGWIANVYEMGKPMPLSAGKGDTREAAREDVGLPAKEGV